MEKKNSIFAGLIPASAPSPAPAPAQAKPESDARVAGLEASVKALRAEINALKQAASRPLPPAPAKTTDAVEPRLERLEKAVTELGFAGQQARQKLNIEGGVSNKELEIVNAGVVNILTLFEVMKRGISQYTAEFSGIERECRKSLGEMQGYVKDLDQKLGAGKSDEYLKESLARMNDKLAGVEKAMHAGLSDLSSRLVAGEGLYGKLFAGAEDRLKKELEPDIQAVNGRLNDLSAKMTLFTDEGVVMDRKMRGLSQYAAEFSDIERECRKSLGEIQGYVKNIDQKLVAERFDEYLKDSVSRLNGKLAGVEKAMHAGLSDLSSRLMTSEVLYGKIFSDAEDKLRKGLEPDMQEVNGRLKDLRAKVTWLTDEYSIVMERKMRVLEAKYSAFDVISARMDTINEVLKSEKNEAADKGRL